VLPAQEQMPAEALTRRPMRSAQQVPLPRLHLPRWWHQAYFRKQYKQEEKEVLGPLGSHAWQRP
jgi:hypothetical protein